MTRFATTIVVLMSVALLVSGCAAQPAANAYSSNGFFLGLFHGVSAPLALIAGMFTDIRIYAYPNTGWLYDLGFLLGLSAWGAGGAAAN